jgi:hypothetical protein
VLYEPDYPAKGSSCFELWCAFRDAEIEGVVPTVFIHDTIALAVMKVEMGRVFILVHAEDPEAMTLKVLYGYISEDGLHH